MIKRLTSLLLSVCMAFSVSAIAAENTTGEGYDVLYNMGFVKKSADDALSRAEFAQIIYDMKTFSDKKETDTSWEDNFFGDMALDVNLIEKDIGKENVTYRFDDIDPHNEYADAVLNLANAGIMNGVEDGIFAPDRTVKNTEIIKTLLDMTGYKTLCSINGGYPAGYAKVAQDNGIIGAAEDMQEKEMTAGEAARLIYNAFDIKLMRPSFGADGAQISTSEKDTFLTGIVKIDYVKGVMTDNGVTSLYGKSDVGKSFIVCGTKTLNNRGDNAALAREYIGYNVKAFYSVADANENDVIYVMPTNKNNVIEINASDVNYFKDGRLNYVLGRSDKNVTLAKNVKMIYNGMAKKSFSESDFLFDDGTVRVIAPSGNNYETVIIDKYVSMYASFVDSGDKIIYNKAYSKDGTVPRSINLEKAYEEKTLGIFDRDGKKLEFSDLKAGMILDVAQSGDVVKIIAGEEKIANFAVKETGEDDILGEYVSDGENTYYIDGAYQSAADKTALVINTTVNLYLNSFGKVAWADKESSYKLKVGYLLRVTSDDELGDETVWLKILNTEGGTARYQAAEKVKFGDADTEDSAKYVRLKSNDFYKKMQSYESGIIGYRLNDDGMVELVELPLLHRGGENRLQLVYDSNGEKVKYKPDGFGYFKDYTWTGNDTKVFTTPIEETTDESKYSCTNRDILQSQADYAFKSYGTNKNGNLAEYLVMQKDVVKSMNFGASYHSFFIVSDVSYELDPDDEPAIRLSGYKTNGYKVGANVSEMTLYAKDDAGEDREGNKVNPALMATDTLSMDVEKNPKPVYYKIKAGDIIRYTYDSEEIYPNAIELLWRADMENPYFGAKGGAKGGIAGSVGVIDSTLTDSGRYNPFVFNDSNGTISGSVTDAYSSYRVMYGFVYSVDNNISTVTTQDLTVEPYDENLGGGKYFKTFVPMRGSATKVLVNFDKKNVTAKVGTLDDVKPYSEYFNECSKMLTITENGYFTTVFVINGEFGK